MIWFRAVALAVVVGLAVVAMTAAQQSPRTPPAAELPTPAPTPVATRVPLPTLAPQAIISRISRDTPVPPPRATQPAQPFVAVVDYGFSPAQMTVKVGTTVEFMNQGEDGHDVTGSGPGGEWRSGPLAPSEHYSRAFGLPGTYDYVCTIHPEMRGRIVVQP